ncbi:MAG: hypothetical protein K0S74_495 [Chlamydiales bacterium]|jgi:tetratricopeptide (TPR) repeat protein|nr:hypothetical protein [Chlamydiales bacterium]
MHTYSIDQLLQSAQQHLANEEFDKAEDLYHTAIKQTPQMPDSYYYLGLLWQIKGDLTEAIKFLEKTIDLSPSHVCAFEKLITLLADTANIARLKSTLAKMEELEICCVEGYIKLVDITSSQDDWILAETYLKKADARGVDNPRVCYSLATIARRRGKLQEAEIHLRKSLIINPSFIEARYDLAVTLEEQGLYIYAKQQLERVLEARPRWSLAIRSLAALQFQMGDLAAVIRYYDSFESDSYQFSRQLSTSTKVWEGEDLGTSNLLVIADLDYTDIIQLVRYLSLITKGSGKIFLKVPKSLVELCRSIAVVDKVFSITDPIDQIVFDYYAPLSKLPCVFQQDLFGIKQAAYLKAPLKYSKKINLSKDKKKKVGFFFGQSNDIYRQTSYVLEAFNAVLEKFPNLSFYYLYTGESPASLRIEIDSHKNVRDVSPFIESYSDAAALISQLDLVISTDNEIAHLAGALGMPVWILLDEIADWRWLLLRYDSIWYPSARLFRSSKNRDWEVITTELISALQQNFDTNPLSLLPPVPNLEIPLISLNSDKTVEALFQNAVDYMRNRQLDKAEDLLYEILYKQPKLAAAYYNLGLIYHSKSILEQAVSAFYEALQIDPIHYKALNYLGKAFVGLDKMADAKICFEYLDKVENADAFAYQTLGQIFQKDGSLDKAAYYLKRALELDPSIAVIYNEFAIIYIKNQNLEVAEKKLKKSLELNPALSESHNNMGILLQKKGNYAEAKAHFEKALELSPEWSIATKNLSFLLLLTGEFEKGWVCYEARLLPPNPSSIRCRKMIKPRWQGEPIREKTLLVRAEQGLGDTIQFARYIPLLAKFVGKIVFDVQIPLKNLFSNFPGIDKLVTYADSLPEYDYYVPLLSLPYIFGTTLQNIPSISSYKGWNHYFSSLNLPILDCQFKKKIGFVWSGSSLYQNDAIRSCRIEELLPILSSFPHTLFYSLQVGDRAKEIQNLIKHACLKNVIDLSPSLTDFTITASVIQQLDLVITVDTSVAHLAGALGKPVWIILPSAPDWRWLTNRIDSPWYPYAKLFRQSNPGDWYAVIENIVESLKDFLGEEKGLSQLESDPCMDDFQIEILIDQAKNLYTQGIYTEAKEIWQKILVYRINHQNAYEQLIQIAEKLGNTDEAFRLLESFIELNPNNLKGYKKIANLLLKIGDKSRVKAYLFKTIKLKIADASIYRVLGGVFFSEEQLKEAETFFRHSIALDPYNSNTYNNLGALLLKKGAFDECELCFQKALVLNPDSLEAKNNLGLLLEKKGKIEESHEIFEKLLAANPDDELQQYNQSFSYLLRGEFSKGWTFYEKRLKNLDLHLINGTIIDKSMWDGLPLGHRTLLVRCEQGFGDIIQFCRYIPLINKQEGKIIFEVYPLLHELCLNLSGVDFVVSKGGKLPEFDCYIPLLSLPRIFKTELNTIPAAIPYLSIDRGLTSNLLKKHNSYKAKVGFVWAGNPKNPIDPIRSCPIDHFIPLFKLFPDICFYSLQVGEKAVEIDKICEKGILNVIDLSSSLKKFSDTARFMQELDLIITVETAVAHLAGAMGLPVWILLPHIPDWRWLLDRSDSPWYPTARLFRQPKIDDWGNVMGLVINSIRKEWY